jgi:hypothetical protein
MLQKLPFFAELDGSKSILLAGCGGGFDVFGALPLYFALRAEGRNVHLASFSFSFPELSLPIVSMMPGNKKRMVTPHMVAVDAGMTAHGRYFPELFLSQWFRSRGEEVPIFTSELSGAKTLADNYRVLSEKLALDAIVLVDGGSDSLMRGDEEGLGTPSEDIASIVAVSMVEVPIKLLACIGFGVDWFHNVCHSRYLEATAELSSAGGFLGLFSVLKEMPEAMHYREACDFVFKRMPGNESIVSTSILSAIDGHFGDYHTSSRTSNGKLWISPLMSAYWGYRLSSVVGRMLYPIDELSSTRGIMDVSKVIIEYRKKLAKIRPWEGIPV